MPSGPSNYERLIDLNRTQHHLDHPTGPSYATPQPPTPLPTTTQASRSPNRHSSSTIKLPTRLYPGHSTPSPPNRPLSATTHLPPRQLPPPSHRNRHKYLPAPGSGPTAGPAMTPPPPNHLSSSQRPAQTSGQPPNDPRIAPKHRAEPNSYSSDHIRNPPNPTPSARPTASHQSRTPSLVRHYLLLPPCHLLHLPSTQRRRHVPY